jgi:hypothetical protein
MPEITPQKALEWREAFNAWWRSRQPVSFIKSPRGFAQMVWHAAWKRNDAEVERLTRENHNLNWALGTDGYDQMATPEEQACHKAGMSKVSAALERFKDRAERFAKIVPDGTDLLEWVEQKHAEVERLTAQNDALRQLMHDEIDENSRLRDLGGAGPDENITAMMERLISEVGRLRKDAERLDTLEASNAGRNMWIVARGKDSFTVALKSPHGNCITRKALREAIDAARGAKG